MRITTTWIACFWLVVGAILVLNGVFQSPPMAADWSWTDTGILGGLGIVTIVEAADLLRRRAVGWWVIAGVNGLAFARWAWGLWRAQEQFAEADSVRVMMPAVVLVLLALCLIGLILDRPSRWQRPAGPPTERLGVSKDLSSEKKA